MAALDVNNIGTFLFFYESELFIHKHLLIVVAFGANTL
jgi:hypothetical protein